MTRPRRLPRIPGKPAASVRLNALPAFGTLRKPFARARVVAQIGEKMERTELCYFDNNATTRIAPEVLDAMLPYFRDRWGNPSSAYAFGHQLAGDLAAAREQVAGLIRAEAREMVFTSCGTESINTALHSALATQPGKRHVVTSATEHSATLKYCQFLQKQGCEVTFLPVKRAGQIDLAELQQAIRADTAIVSLIWANNETGVILPMGEIARLCRERGVLCHTDAVQAAGKIEIDVTQVPVDFLSLSAHKLHAPKGVGALFVRRKTKFQPYLMGGSQERGRRSGTENVPYLIGFGRAAEMAAKDLGGRAERMRRLRDRLEQGVLSGIPGAQVNGAEPRLPNTTNIAFAGVEAEGVLLLLDQAGICASSGSACTTGSLEPSHVLTAMGLSAAQARGSVRFSLGTGNSEQEVDYLLQTLPRIVERLRAHAPVEEAG